MSHSMPESPPPSFDRTSLRKVTGVQFLLRGLAISLPPILTVVILLWVGKGINDYLIHPTTTLVRYSIATLANQARPIDQFVTWDRLPAIDYCGRDYRITPDLKERLVQQYQSRADRKIDPDEFASAEADQIYVPMAQAAVPYTDFREVAARLRPLEMPTTAIGSPTGWVTKRYFQSLFHLSVVAIAILIVALYFLGRFVTARIGAWMVHKFETTVLGRLPLVSTVYSSVKQVTDFFFTERTVDYNQVVAVEYPRKGIWSLAFVTGDGMLDIAAAAGEPMVTVLIPTSPMPMTGYTMTIPRSEVIEMNLTVDQAFQFCISCGVLVPPQQIVTPDLLQLELSRRLTGGRKSGSDAAAPTSGGGLPAGGTVLPTPVADATTADRRDGETS